MSQAQRGLRQAGFTLVELLITLAVIAIVARIAAVNMIQELPRYRLNQAATQLVWTLRALRLRAISQHHTVTVTFINDHMYTVWTDHNDNGDIDSDEVQTMDLRGTYPDVTLTATTNPILQPTGTVTNPPTITLTNPSGTKRFTMNIIGHMTFQ